MLRFPIYAEIKYDGFYTRIEVDADGTRFYTSGDKLFLLEDSPFHNRPHGVYFAEMIGITGKLGDRQNCGMQTTFRVNTSKGIKNKGWFNWRVFDYVSFDEFSKGISSHDFMHRKGVRDSIFDNSLLPEGKWMNSVAEIEEFIMFVTKLGWEGLVLKYHKMLWEDTTSRRDSLVKYKKIPTFDLRVDHITEGTGKYEGMIGALVLTDGNGKFVGKVGTGLDDDDRANPRRFLNRVVEVAAERISPTGMLIQPRLIAVREEKELDVIQ